MADYGCIAFWLRAPHYTIWTSAIDWVLRADRLCHWPYRSNELYTPCRIHLQRYNHLTSTSHAHLQSSGQHELLHCTADCSGVRLAAEEQKEVVTWSLDAVIVPRHVPCVRLALCSSIHRLGGCFGRPVSQRSLSRQSARCLSQGMLCDRHAPVVNELRLHVRAAGCDHVQWLDKAVYRKCDTEQYVAWDGFDRRPDRIAPANQ